MTITKKHLQLIADAFANFNCTGNSQDAMLMRECIARDVARRLKNENPRFDEDRFLKACQVERSY